MKNIAVFASHGGSDLQAIIDGCKHGGLDARVCVVISNNSNAMALKRAENEHIPAFHISEKTTRGAPDAMILRTLLAHNTDIVFLAGYLKKMGESILRTYENNIYNIHPSLLPKYGGRGMYGIHVHKAVLDANETETGITIHRVTAAYDQGEIIAQTKVAVLADDTPEVLAARVLAQEHIFLVGVLQTLLSAAGTL